VCVRVLGEVRTRPHVYSCSPTHAKCACVGARVRARIVAITRPFVAPRLLFSPYHTTSVIIDSMSCGGACARLQKLFLPLFATSAPTAPAPRPAADPRTQAVSTISDVARGGALHASLCSPAFLFMPIPPNYSSAPCRL
jgi:hypothetical protein